MQERADAQFSVPRPVQETIVRTGWGDGVQHSRGVGWDAQEGCCPVAYTVAVVQSDGGADEQAISAVWASGAGCSSSGLLVE